MPKSAMARNVPSQSQDANGRRDYAAYWNFGPVCGGTWVRTWHYNAAAMMSKKVGEGVVPCIWIY